MTDQYDLAVLGGGSGGLAAAQQAARLGAKVVLFEPGRLGGTCVHVGCVPKKALWLAADLAHQVELARGIGFNVSAGALDWPAFVARRQAYIDRAEAGYAQRLVDLGIRVVRERARLGSDNTVSSHGVTVQATHRLIATGGRPARVDVPGFEYGALSDDVFGLDRLPRRIAIVGGGYIAVEMAGLLHGLGAEVTLFVRGDQVLGHFDADLAEALAGSMRARGIVVHTRSAVDAVERRDGGVLLRTSGERVHRADWLLWAIGRVPNSEDLGLEDIGVSLDARGHVIIDPYQCTSVPGVFAVGDVATQPALTPVAIAAARRLVERLFSDADVPPLDLANVPTVVFAQPPLATCGLTEAQARASWGDDVQVHHARFRPMREALAGDAQTMFIKLVCVGAEERVVGLHVHGPGADEILQGFAVALRLGARRRDFNETLAIHPTAAEEVVLAGR
jgi:glutathione reductase (NADPH)